MNKKEQIEQVKTAGKRMILAAVITMLFAMMIFTINVSAQEAETGVEGAWNSLMAVGGVTLLAVGVLLLIVPKIFTDIGPGVKKAMTYGAAFFLIVGTFGILGVTLTGDGGDPTPPVDPTEGWFGTLADNSTDIVWLDEYTANWNINYNTTSNAIHSSNDSAIFTLSVGRADDSNVWYYDTASIGTIGEVTATSTGLEFPVIARGSDGLFEADWSNTAGTFNYECTLPDTEARADTANLTIELSDKAFEECIVAQGGSFTITYFDFTWTINVVVAEIYA